MTSKPVKMTLRSKQKALATEATASSKKRSNERVEIPATIGDGETVVLLEPESGEVPPIESSQHNSIDITKELECLLANRQRECEGASFLPEGPANLPTLIAAADLAHRAIEEAVIAYAESHEDAFGKACDQYTIATKGFAKTILAERIRQFTKGMDRVSRPSELANASGHADKLKFARTIHDWLAPWNLVFQNNADNALYQLYAVETGREGGRFSLSQYGPSSPRHKINAWSEVAKVISDPVLVDTTRLSDSDTGAATSGRSR